MWCICVVCVCGVCGVGVYVCVLMRVHSLLMHSQTMQTFLSTLFPCALTNQIKGMTEGICSIM